MAGSDILDSVRFIKNDKVLCKKDPMPTLLTIDRTTQQSKEECVIEDDHVGSTHPPTPGLIKTAWIFCACPLRADMLLTSHLFPNRGLRLELEITQRAVSGRETPFSNSLELGALPGRKE